jgi:hypothetical protein
MGHDFHTPTVLDLVNHNIEFSCAAESPTRSLPSDSQRLYHESIVHFRRQLQRFVMKQRVSTSLTEDCIQL